jgi:hypothetical protein
MQARSDNVARYKVLRGSQRHAFERSKSATSLRFAELDSASDVGISLIERVYTLFFHAYPRARQLNLQGDDKLSPVPLNRRGKTTNSCNV